jgi:hypothetical protein
MSNKDATWKDVCRAERKNTNHVYFFFFKK